MVGGGTAFRWCLGLPIVRLKNPSIVSRGEEGGLEEAIQVFMGGGGRTGGRTGGDYSSIHGWRRADRKELFKYSWVEEGGQEVAIQVLMGWGGRTGGSYSSIHGWRRQDWMELYKHSFIHVDLCYFCRIGMILIQLHFLSC